jgi:hypothetical protein
MAVMSVQLFNKDTSPKENATFFYLFIPLTTDFINKGFFRIGIVWGN